MFQIDLDADRSLCADSDEDDLFEGWDFLCESGGAGLPTETDDCAGRPSSNCPEFAAVMRKTMVGLCLAQRDVAGIIGAWLSDQFFVPLTHTVLSFLAGVQTAPVTPVQPLSCPCASSAGINLAPKLLPSPRG